MSELAIHPAAELFPMMGESELRELADDIKANGLVDRIVLHDGMILDGRNRYTACKLAGVEPLFQNPDASMVSPVLYVISKNIHRRHLTPSQRGAIAAEMIPLLQEEAKKRQGKRNDLHPTSTPTGVEVPRGPAAEIAAKAMQVGEGTVQRALQVKKSDPETFEKIKRGEISANAAANGHKEQPQIGGTRRDHAAPFQLDTERNRQRAEANKRKMIDGLAVVGGVCHGLENLDVAIAAAACDAEEIDTWATKAENHAREIKRFAAKLRGAMGNGESE